MTDYDNGFRRAQQMYDAQEEPTNDEPEEAEPRRCHKCGGEMDEHRYNGKVFARSCKCGHEEKV